jgi:hypothetical protein
MTTMSWRQTTRLAAAQHQTVFKLVRTSALSRSHCERHRSPSAPSTPSIPWLLRRCRTVLHITMVCCPLISYLRSMPTPLRERARRSGAFRVDDPSYCKPVW